MSFRMIAQGKLILPVSWRIQNKLYRNTEKKRNVVRNFVRRFRDTAVDPVGENNAKYKLKEKEMRLGCRKSM